MGLCSTSPGLVRAPLPAALRCVYPLWSNVTAHACSASAIPSLTDHCGAIQRLIQSQYCLAWPSAGTVAPSNLWILVCHNRSSSTTAGAAASVHLLIYVRVWELQLHFAFTACLSVQILLKVPDCRLSKPRENIRLCPNLVLMGG